MFDSKKPNPNCNYADEVVSYIYDEMESSEKSSFEIHLVNCTPCSEEIVAFSNVSFSIKEWRNEEFAKLETPQILIPYENALTKTNNINEEIDSPTWLDSLKHIFNFSPLFTKTATAFGTIALALGLGWFLMSSSTDQNEVIAKKPNKSQEQKNDLINVNKDEIETKADKLESLAKNDDATNDSESLENSAKPQKIIARNKIKKVKKKTSVGKKHKRKLSPIIAKTKKIPSNKDLNKKDKTLESKEIREIPRLTDFAIEESEETEIRLTDFFDDETGD